MEKNGKRRQKLTQHLGFVSHNIPRNILGPSQGVYKIEDCGSHRSRNLCDGNFYWRERKMGK